MIDLRRARLSCTPMGARLYFGGSGNRGAESSTTSTQQDNRVVAGDGSTALGASAVQDNSIKLTDTSTRNQENSGNVSTTTTVYGADAPQIVKLTAELQAAMSEGQIDAVKALSQFGTDALRSIGGSVTDLYEQAGKNSTLTTEQLLSTSRDVLGRLIDGSKANSDAASVVAQAAIASFTPTENKNADVVKYAAIAAAGIGALLLFAKKG